MNAIRIRQRLPGWRPLAAVALLALPVGALAQDQAQDTGAVAMEAPTTAAERPDTRRPGGRDPDAMTCRRETVTGSRVPSRRVCRTNREWEEIAAAGNRRVRDTMERIPSTGTREGMGP